MARKPDATSAHSSESPSSGPSPFHHGPHLKGLPGGRGGDPPPPSEPRPFLDPTTGFEGYEVSLVGGRELPTPCIADGLVFLGAGFGSYEFYALDADTGRCRWSCRTRDDGPTAATYADGRVVYNTESCTLCVHDAISGKVLWERWLGDPLLAQPAVGLDRIFMAYPSREAGEHRHQLAALSLGDGSTLWKVPLEADVITAPVVAEGHIWASTFDGRVSCWVPETGECVWSKDLQATSAPWV